ncbi:uncharacterized protein LOC128884066 isoform X2 [Hylaeus volcanicus]|uniref:uncharacterized protein LOC128884066 isoform X2 n=1 Tax=Hylaeus volcanicus TaxID=313075 RepID=UPI0023B817A7|nr:uncharacterized protein LOC128884066 isoform X2 [Hylaeus volcanicus]
MPFCSVVRKGHFQEFLSVYDLIFAEDSRDEKKAREKILVWESNDLTIPEAVVSTRTFLDASIADNDYHDTIKDNPNFLSKESALQVLYAVAIENFVKFFFSENKNKMEFQESSANSHFIQELQTCYQCFTNSSKLPSVNVLRNVSKGCFQYLFVNFWEPEALNIRSQLMTRVHSKQLASGLVAVLQDLESLAPSDPHMEASLKSLLGVTPLRKHGGENFISLKKLLQCVAMVAGLKQKETMRALRRFKIPEVLSEPAFITAGAWCQSLREALPSCFSFIDCIFHSCSHENVALSFLKDFLLLMYDPELVTNATIILTVFWILSKVSVTFIDRLVASFIYAITGLQVQKGKPAVHPTSSSSSLHDSSHTRDSNITFDHQSFSLWLRTMGISNEQEKQTRLYLESDFGYQSRLLKWLKCLFLLPQSLNSGDDIYGLPDNIDFLLHLFCGLQLNSFFQQFSLSGGSMNRHSSLPAIVFKDAFCQRFISVVTTTHTRIVASCQSMLDLLAYGTVQCLLKKENVASERGLRSILRLFEEMEVLRVKNVEGKFIEWLTQRVEYSVTPSTMSKRGALQRLYPMAERRSLGDSGYKRRSSTSLFQEFSSRLISRQAKLQRLDDGTWIDVNYPEITTPPAHHAYLTNHSCDSSPSRSNTTKHEPVPFLTPFLNPSSKHCEAYFDDALQCGSTTSMQNIPLPKDSLFVKHFRLKRQHAPSCIPQEHCKRFRDIEALTHNECSDDAHSFFNVMKESRST